MHTQLMMQPISDIIYTMFLGIMFSPSNIPTMDDLYNTPPEDDKRLPLSVSLTTCKADMQL